jgi:NAD(P)H-flavin reductase
MLQMLDIPDLSQTHVVIVGPPVMMKYTSAQFFSRGIKQEQIWLSFDDAWPVAWENAATAKSTTAMSWLMDQYSVTIKPYILLD